MRGLALALLMAAGAMVAGSADTVPGMPWPDGRLYVANLRSSDVIVIDLETRGVAGRVALPLNPHELALSADSGELVVSLYRSAAVASLDVSTLAVRQYEVAGAPHGVAALAGGRRLITSGEAGGILLLDGDGALRGVLATGYRPHAVTVDPAGHRAYVANAGDGTLAVIDIEDWTLVDRVATGAIPESVAVSPDGELVLTANAGDNTVSVIDAVALREAERLALPGRPVRVAIAPDGRTALVSLATTGRIAVIGLRHRRVVALVEVGPGPDGIAFSTDGRVAFIAEGGANRVRVLEAGTWRTLALLDAGDGPSGLVHAPLPAPPVPDPLPQMSLAGAASH